MKDKKQRHGSPSVVVAIALTLLLILPGSKASAQPKIVFKIVMSKDNNVCDAILNFYNLIGKARDQQDKGTIEDQFQYRAKKTGIDFLSNNTPILADIYNDGLDVVVYVMDAAINTSYITAFTRVLILKKGESFSPDINIGNSKVEAWIDFSNGGPSQGWSPGHYDPFYVLRDYPNVNKLLEEAKNGRPSILKHPMLGQGTLQRIFSYHNNTYVVARGAPILVYRALHGGKISDVCYLDHVSSLGG